MRTSKLPRWVVRLTLVAVIAAVAIAANSGFQADHAWTALDVWWN